MPVQRPDGIDSRVRSAANRCLRERRYKLVGSPFIPANVMEWGRRRQYRSGQTHCIGRPFLFLGRSFYRPAMTQKPHLVRPTRSLLDVSPLRADKMLDFG
jgi:hypothetical protein